MKVITGIRVSFVEEECPYEEEEEVELAEGLKELGEEYFVAGQEEVFEVNKWLLRQKRYQEAEQMADDAELWKCLLEEYHQSKGNE